MFAAWVSVETASESVAATTEKPSSSSPRLSPPAPQNRSTAHGRGRLSSHLRTASPSFGVRRIGMGFEPDTFSTTNPDPVSRIAICGKLWDRIGAVDLSRISHQLDVIPVPSASTAKPNALALSRISTARAASEGFMLLPRWESSANAQSQLTLAGVEGFRPRAPSPPKSSSPLSSPQPASSDSPHDPRRHSISSASALFEFPPY